MSAKGGPKPVPTKLKILHGTHRADRHGDPELEPEGNLLIEIPAPPESLGEVGRDKWVQTLRRLQNLGLAEEEYLDAVEVYCMAWDEFDACTRDIEENGSTFINAKGYISQSPSVNRRFKAGDVIRRYLVEFGLTPSSRTSVSARTPPKNKIPSRSRKTS